MSELKKFSAVILLIFSFNCLHGQDDFLEQDFNIWEAEEQQPLYQGRQALQTLCDYYDLILEDVRINCFEIKLRPHSISLNNHIISRRETDAQLEGSGDDGSLVPKENAEEDVTEYPELEDASKANDTQDDIKINVALPENPASNTNNDEVKPVIEENQETDGLPISNTEDTDNDASPVKSDFDNDYELESPPENNKNEKEQKEDDTDSNPIKESEISLQTKEISEKETPERLPPKALPSDLEEVDPIKEKEALDVTQTINADIINYPQEEVNGIEGVESEKVLRKLATNANEQIGKDAPDTRQSSKDVQSASKSISVLIILLVIGVLVAAAIFIRKYTKKNQDKYQTPPTTEKNGDVEQGTELKPLMKENNKLVTESPDSTK